MRHKGIHFIMQVSNFDVTSQPKDMTEILPTPLLKEIQSKLSVVNNDVSPRTIDQAASTTHNQFHNQQSRANCFVSPMECETNSSTNFSY